MVYSSDCLNAAHHHSSDHRQEVAQSKLCGCFYCCKSFSPASIQDWLEDEGGTALCPFCDIDSVIGSASGYPVSDQDFLRAMHARWFDKHTQLPTEL